MCSKTHSLIIQKLAKIYDIPYIHSMNIYIYICLRDCVANVYLRIHDYNAYIPASYCVVQQILTEPAGHSRRLLTC